MLEKITNTFSSIVRKISGKATITEKNIEEAVEEIKIALLEADVNLRVVRRFINATIEEAKGETVLKSVNPGQQFIKIVHDKILSFLGDEKKSLQLKGPDTQSVILFLGLQGSGKTTSAAKLAARLKKEGRKPLLVACDLVRPAAVEQLSSLGERIDVPVYKEDTKDAVRVAQNAVIYARKNGFDTVIVDTAGRLQTKVNLMEELAKISRVVKKVIPDAPHQTILVLDATTGQNAVSQAQNFGEIVPLTGVVLTKLDGTAKGGVVLSIHEELHVPIRWIGLGEREDDLQRFNALEFAKALFETEDHILSQSTKV